MHSIEKQQGHITKTKEKHEEVQGMKLEERRNKKSNKQDKLSQLNHEIFMPGAVIRKKADRRKLQGVACPCCQPYYDALDLSPESKEKRINEVSRHRYVQPPPSTPEHYWEMEFPSTPVCLERGYITETVDAPAVKPKVFRRLWSRDPKQLSSNNYEIESTNLNVTTGDQDRFSF